MWFKGMVKTFLYFIISQINKCYYCYFLLFNVFLTLQEEAVYTCWTLLNYFQPSFGISLSFNYCIHRLELTVKYHMTSIHTDLDFLDNHLVLEVPLVQVNHLYMNFDNQEVLGARHNLYFLYAT